MRIGMIFENPDWASQLGRAARQTICERYSMEHLGRRYLVYRALLGS